MTDHAPRCPKAFSCLQPVWRWAALLLLCLLTAGCGFSTQEMFPTEYATVAVPIFENRTFYRGVEVDLAEAIGKELEQRTPYKITSPNVADTLLEGRITSMTQRGLSRTTTGGLPQEQEVTITIDFTWKDLRRGDVIVSRRGFSAVGRYIPTQPVGEEVLVGQHSAVQRMAEDLVSAMRSGW